MIADDNTPPHPADTSDEPPEAFAVEYRPPEKLVRPPHSLEAEREVLGAVFIDGRALETLAASLTTASFYFERHQIVFATMLEIGSHGAAIDIVTVHQALKDRRQLDKVGGVRALSELMDRAGTVTNLEHYVAIVRAKERQRRIVELAQSIEHEGLGDVDDVDAFVQSFAARAGSVIAQVAKPPEPMRLKSISERVEAGEPDWLEEAPPAPSVLMKNLDGSPFMLDSRVGVVEAPGGTGKSWLVIQLAVAVACGGRWLETYECRKGRVLLALGEERDQEIWRRVWRVAQSLGLDSYQRDEVKRNLVPLGLDGEEVAFLQKAPDGNITETPFYRQVQAAMDRDGPFRLAVFDPLSYFGGPEVESDPYIATRFIRCGSRLTRAAGEPAVLYTAHSRKKQLGIGQKLDADNTRGSSAIVDGARWVCSVAKRAEKLVAMKVTKTNYTVPGEQLTLTRGKGGVPRVATEAEIAEAEEQERGGRRKA